MIFMKNDFYEIRRNLALFRSRIEVTQSTGWSTCDCYSHESLINIYIVLLRNVPSVGFEVFQKLRQMF